MYRVLRTRPLLIIQYPTTLGHIAEKASRVAFCQHAVVMDVYERLKTSPEADS